MENNCITTCRYASNEYIDNAIMDRWDGNAVDFLNSFSDIEIRGIACYLSSRANSVFVYSFDVNNLQAGEVLHDYIRVWMLDNLYANHLCGIGQLFCLLCDIDEAQEMLCA